MICINDVTKVNTCLNHYLGGTSNHVLDEITMSGGIDDGDVELSGLELPQSNIDGDTTFTLGLEFVQNPGVLEGAFAHLFQKKLG